MALLRHSVSTFNTSKILPKQDESESLDNEMVVQTGKGQSLANQQISVDTMRYQQRRKTYLGTCPFLLFQETHQQLPNSIERAKLRTPLTVTKSSKKSTNLTHSPLCVRERREITSNLQLTLKDHLFFPAFNLSSNLALVSLGAVTFFSLD